MRELVVDADGHVCEPPDLWTRALPASLRERGIRLRWNAETGFDEAWVEDWCITDRGLVGLGNAGTPFVDLGRGRRYADGNPAGFGAHERLRILDEEGIDAAVLYPGLALSLRSWAGAAVALATAAWLQFRVLRDERRLGERFGEPYLQYCSRVKRWIPALF